MAKFGIPPIAPTLAIIGSLYYPIDDAINGRYSEALDGALWRIAGWNMKENRFDAKGLVQGWTPILVGFAAHWLASKMGWNRTLAQMGLPIRI
jgi:hypothetical protein